SCALVAAGSVAGQRRRGRGADWVRTLSTGRVASWDGAACGRGGRARRVRPRARGEHSLVVRRNPRPTVAAHRTRRLAGDHCCPGVSDGACRGSRAGSIVAARLAEQLGARDQFRSTPAGASPAASPWSSARRARNLDHTARTDGIMSRVRIGILGSGFQADCIAQAVKATPEEGEVVAVASPTKGHAAGFAKRHRIPRTYTDYRELLRDPEVEMVS